MRRFCGGCLAERMSALGGKRTLVRACRGREATAVFDVSGAYSRQFTPVEDGYIYYPSRKGGGKLVTVEEYDNLVADWQRIAGSRGRWKTVGVAVFAILLWTLAGEVLALPEWWDWILTVACVAGLSGWLLWASLAPRRLVRDRPDIVPPRRALDVRREARATLTWPFVILMLFISGTVFIRTLSSLDRLPPWWAWLIGSGTFFGSYLWIALQKLRDRAL
jgi:hypothetical protein